MNTRDELRAAAHQAAQRAEPDFGTPYIWPDVRPYTKAPRLNPTLVLDNTPRDLADRLAGLHPVMADALRPLIFRSLP